MCWDKPQGSPPPSGWGNGGAGSSVWFLGGLKDISWTSLFSFPTRNHHQELCMSPPSLSSKFSLAHSKSIPLLWTPFPCPKLNCGHFSGLPLSSIFSSRLSPRSCQSPLFNTNTPCYSAQNHPISDSRGEQTFCGKSQ